MPTTSKSSIKKSSSVKKNNKKKPSIKHSPYIVPQENKPEKSQTTLGISNHLLNPINPKSRETAIKLKRGIDLSSLSAQASASIFRDDLAERIPREEAEEHIRLITSLAPTAMLAGSFRRGAQMGNDIDVVIREPIESVLERMQSIGYIKHTFSSGKHKFSGIVKLPNYRRFRHLDIVMTTARAYPFAMLYFTGSKKHNIIMRMKAKKLGFKLNEYGLFRGDDLVPGITTERDIFNALGIAYREPNERN